MKRTKVPADPLSRETSKNGHADRPVLGRLFGDLGDDKTDTLQKTRVGSRDYIALNFGESGRN